MHSISCRIYNSGCHENDEILFSAVGSFTTKQAAHKRNVAEDRNFLPGLANALRDQAAEHHRLAVPNDRAGCHLPNSESWQRGVLHGNSRNNSTKLPGRFRVISEELGKRWKDMHLDRV